MVDLGIWIHCTGVLHLCDSDLDVVRMSETTWKVWLPCVNNANRSKISEVVNRFKKRGIKIWNISLTSEPFWKSFERGLGDQCEQEIVGFEVAGDYELPVSYTSDDFVSEFKNACNPPIEEDRRINCKTRPNGLLANIGPMLVAKKELTRVLCRFNKEIRCRSSLYYNDIHIANWSVLEIPVNVDCLDTEFGTGLVCMGCGNPYFGDFGMLFGKPLDSSTIGRDVSGWNHFGNEHPFIVSSSIAKDLKSSLTSAIDFSLQPIFDRRGPTALTVKSILAECKSIWSTNPNWNVDPRVYFG